MGLSHTLILVDDHALMRAGIRSLLEPIGNIEIIGETGDGTEALRMIRQNQPDLVILDVTLPGLNGLEITERVAGLGIATRILLLSMHASPEYVARGLHAGASGYLVKEAAFEELAEALKMVLAGRKYLSRTVDRESVDNYRRRLSAGDDDLNMLTPRQRQILQLIAEGGSTRTIAEHLNVSIKTVETHRAQLMERLRIRDVPGLVRYAIRAGIISPDA